MKFLDLTLPSPAANLACDEALWRECEQANAEGVLRFWEPAEPFVVLGQGNPVSTEVDLAACRAERVPVLRRCTGGGAVVQAPGCLNYALVLRISDLPELRSITRTNAWVMAIQRRALEGLLREPVGVQGMTDLTLRGRKVSGNAQRRGRTHVLFHGTFLFACDLSLMERLLPVPSRQPDYRQYRAHREFVANLDVAALEVRGALRAAWRAHEPLRVAPLDAIERLVQERYGQASWTFRF